MASTTLAGASPSKVVRESHRLMGSSPETSFCGMPWGFWRQDVEDGAGLVGSDQPTSGALIRRQVLRRVETLAADVAFLVCYLFLASQGASSIPINVCASTCRWAASTEDATASTESVWFVPEVKAVEAVEAIPTILRGWHARARNVPLQFTGTWKPRCWRRTCLHTRSTWAQRTSWRPPRVRVP